MASRDAVASSEEGDALAMFSVSEDLVASPKHKAPGTTTLDFGGLLSIPLKLHEDLTEGCGGQLWPAGMVLAKYLLELPRDSLENRSILELGAGGGLVGLAVANYLHVSVAGSEMQHRKLGCKLRLTDQAPLIPLLEHNIAANSLESYVIASVLDWGTPILSQNVTPPDILLAADCVYFEPAFPLLLSSLHELIAKDTICYFCFKKRRKADLRFVHDLRKEFVVENLSQSDGEVRIGFKGIAREGIFLYKVTRKP